jgi:hypothetical protein
MVINYRDIWQGLRARKVLAAAGIAVRYTPNRLLCVPTDLSANPWLVHRLEVSARGSRVARALLSEYDLLPPPDVEMFN